MPPSWIRVLRPGGAAARRVAIATCIALPVVATGSRSAAQDVDTAESGQGESLPLWEVAVGGFALYAPDYPASGEYSINGLGAPLVVYRGDLFRLGEDAAVRVVPVDEPLFELGVSVDAAFGADSDDNELREGLPDLDPLLELGPELIVRGPRLDYGAWGEAELDLALQGRAVFSLDFDEVAYRGLVFEPDIRYRQRGLLGGDLDLFGSVGPVFATEELHDYFYEVEPQFARPGREAFAADGGYLGTEIDLAMAYEGLGPVQLFAGVQVGLYGGAANADSPLFERDATAAVFFGLSWTLFESERQVIR